jgi:hypothetical protein
MKIFFKNKKASDDLYWQLGLVFLALLGATLFVIYLMNQPVQKAKEIVDLDDCSFGLLRNAKCVSEEQLEEVCVDKSEAVKLTSICKDENNPYCCEIKPEKLT